MYKHAFDSYMTHAFPADELRPLTCDGRLKRERGDLDAMLGNYSMTLIDALDSLVIFKRKTAFKVAVSYIGDNVHFNKDIEVSTFEVNIRTWAKALDLGDRLLRAFDTPTGMPRSRVNLQSGIPKGSSSTVTIAEAGSFLLEFGMLSVLSGQSRFYHSAKRSLVSFWGRRNVLDLVGTSIDVNTGNFVDQKSTTGPGTRPQQDSFFEYLLKGYILFQDLELLDIFLSAYAAARVPDSPLRPELIEAIFYLSLALPGDAMVFEMSKSIATAIDEQSRVACGFASVADVTTKRLDNRMDSFFLSETLVYLYLAVAPPEAAQPRSVCGGHTYDMSFLRAEDLAAALPWPIGASIFTTEGHIFPLQGLPPGADIQTVQRSQAGYRSFSSWDGQRVLIVWTWSKLVLSPFERVAVQQRCRTKYLLTPSYQMQMAAETTRRCRPQVVTLLVWSDGAFTDNAMHITGLASSLGRPVPVRRPRHAAVCPASLVRR
ncbi:unnamed protein product [Effrenium voratum]|uniref:alpha-1,2-Mannosidase n=1 Tax=Effrenium voratum TaxID=2562239 RepID=A0AA36IV54_9DINO|nr:unnamed protein product [Effrenium voratum]